MTRLLLTSAGMAVKNEIFKLLDKPVSETVIANIITAAKVEPDKSFFFNDRQELINAGFKVRDIDIEGREKDELKKELNDADIIYVQGGNTFYLLKHARKSGFDELVKELLDQGKIYIGVSAGSYIACPTIEMAAWKHQDRERYGVEDFRALNLVPFLITAHYKPRYKDVIKRGIEKTKLPVKILTDDQAILVEDKNISLVGNREPIDIDNL